MAKKALGKGLEALIPGGVWGGAGGTLTELRIAEVAPNPFQPRRKMDEKKLEELASSIKARGVIQPVVVRRAAGGYELVAGERRLRAAERLGMATIPAIVREATDSQALELSLVENLQRDDLNAMEEAVAYRELRERFGMTQEALAVAMGRDRSSVANTLRLLSLPEEVCKAISDGALSRGHALALAGLASERDQKVLARKIIARGLSVRETEAIARRMSHPAARARKRKDPHVAAVEGDLRERLGTQVKIRGTGRRGKIEISYSGADELERLVELLLAPGGASKAAY